MQFTLILLATFTNVAMAASNHAYSVSYALAPSRNLRGRRDTCDTAAAKAIGRVVSLQMSKSLNVQLAQLQSIATGPTACRKGSCLVNLVDSPTTLPTDHDILISTALQTSCETALQTTLALSRIDDKCRKNLAAATCQVSALSTQ